MAPPSASTSRDARQLGAPGMPPARHAKATRRSPARDAATLGAMSRGGYRALAANGTEYARRVLRGEEPILQIPFRSFAAELGLTLRPHFFALSSIAALAGAAGHYEQQGAVPKELEQ